MRAAHLAAYQSKRLAKRYRKMLSGIDDPRLREAVATGYHNVLAYKDEYEVARLHLATREKAAQHFDGDFKMTFHLAPPLLTREGPDGRPRKKEYGEGMLRNFRALAKLRRLRGTPIDPFGYSAERRAERALIRQYEADMKAWLPRADAARMDALVALAELPLQIRGFGPVKAANMARAEKRRAELIAALEAGHMPLREAAE